jgi:hypothetical protein
MNQELKYYMSLSYRMEIFEDKDEGGGTTSRKRTYKIDKF